MSANAGRAPRVSAPANDSAPPVRRRWRVHVNQDSTGTGASETHIPAGRLQAAALQASYSVASDRDATRDFHRAAQEESRSEAPTTAAEAPEAEQTAALPVSAGSENQAAGPAAGEPTPTFEPAEMPEIEVEESAAEAAADASAAMETAEDAAGLMNAFRDAPPSIKAMHHDRLDGDLGALSSEDQAQFEDGLPVIEAAMSGVDDLPQSEPVRTPEAAEAQLENGEPARPVAPEVEPTHDPGSADLNPSGSALVSSWFTEGDAHGLGRAFSSVSTGDSQVDTSAGERPQVPLEGATDPQRVADQDEAARAEAGARRQAATRAVLEGPGPEQVQLQALREEFRMDAREVPQIEEAEGPVEGAAAFREKQLDAEVVALFDAHHNDNMAASMERASAEVGAAVETRNSERDKRVAETEAERDSLNAEADEAQRSEVGSRRQQVQEARQAAVDEQAQHVADVEAEADTRRSSAQSEIDEQVSSTQRKVDTQFSEAEARARERVEAGEREAEEERQRQASEAEDLSWWERAANWVADQFDRLTRFINRVFDAVRAAVSAIIDKVKDAALALIDLAAAAITAAIEALGEALKAAVNALLAEHFPAVAAALNDAIDSAVETATAAVNAVAEGLKAAVSALLDLLAAALDAILAAFQAAVNAALAIARAALTGDWDALAQLILEPILRALGIEPQAFYDMIARAMEALDLIIDDPLGFLSNLVEAFVGGVRNFGSNLLTHLQQGIIAWLTGALGGSIQIPERFDLMGVLDLARQILGLTVDMIRRVVVRILGEEAVERIEYVMDYVVDLVSDGFSGLWERIMADLGNLKDTVLEGIRSFLQESVIMAAITWLASLFNPIGALIKLVMTIWNVFTFLRDQLARIFQVFQTIMNAMMDIVRGVLQPAMQGVENALGRLLPIAIDFLARLLGLGNVARRVQDVIESVRQRIEDAIVRLINRVLSAFTGRRRGVGAGESEAPADQAGEIMAPIAVRGGGESHTLSIEDRGETVVPMIRSTPQTVQSWLAARSGAPFEELARERNWRGAVKNNKKAQLERLVAVAREEEAQLDRAAEATEDALNANPATATDEQQATAAEGQQTRRALEQVLEFFGIDPDASLADHFDAAITALGNEGLRSRLRRNVLNRLDTPRYLTMDWAQARVAIPADPSIPASWSRPATSSGLLRALHDETFLPAVKRIVESHTSTPEDFSLKHSELERFLSDYLAQDLNQASNAREIVVLILRGQSGDAIAGAMSAVIQAAADRRFGNLSEWDFAFNDVTGSYYRNQLVPNIATIIGGNFGKYYEDDAENAAGSGAGVDQPLSYFLSTSKRASKNRTRLANSVRAANPGNHEWIPSARAASVISSTAARIGTDGETDALAGLAKLLRFQHEVRTPTSHLIFKPNASLSQLGRTVPYFSRAHADSGISGELTPEQRQQYYPEGGPQARDPIVVLQAHAGGLDAGVVENGTRAQGDKLQWASPEWHSQLVRAVDQPIADNIASNADGSTIKSTILGFYRDTIWRGAVPLPGSGPRFDLYYTSYDDQWRDYEAMKRYAAARYAEAEFELTRDMNRVFP